MTLNAASRGAASGVGGQAGEGHSWSRGKKTFLGGSGDHLCPRLLTGQVRQVWRTNHWTSSMDMMVTLTGVVSGTK